MESTNEPPTTEESSDQTIGPKEALPESLAGYRVLRRLGGGPGSAVYRAEQKDPQRPVALKVVRGGDFAAEHYTKLFEREIQRITGLNHPFIAEIYEVGNIDQASLFFAMELVRGFPINEYTRMHKLSQRKRIQLFSSVCKAVSHAHQCGIVHQDLRPENIFIDADGNPRILDFGVSCIADPELERATPYMSPEQARSGGKAPTPTTDVYSLGVILYELITGRLPYPIKDATREEAFQTILNAIPSKPGGIVGSLDSDLEAIMLKPLAKNPSNRYASVEAFTNDLERYLNRQPVAARPADAMHSLRLSMRRNRRFSVAALVAFVFGGGLLVAAGAFGTRRLFSSTDSTSMLTQQLRVAREERTQLERKLGSAESLAAERLSMLETAKQGRDTLAEGQTSEIEEARLVAWEQQNIAEANLARAQDAERSVELEKKRVLEAAASARNLSSVILGILEVFQTEYGTPRVATVDELLNRSVQEAAEKLGDQPEIYASLMHSLGLAYQALGRVDHSVSSLQAALVSRRKALGPDHVDTIRSMNSLALLYYAQERLAEAEPLCQALMESVIRSEGAGHPRALTTMNNLARLLEAQGKFAEAEPLYRRSLEGRRTVLGEDHPKTLASMNNLASVLAAQGNPAEAEPLRLLALEGFSRVLGERHPKTLSAMCSVAKLFEAQGRYPEAKSLYSEVIHAGAELRPEDGWIVAVAGLGVGGCLMAEGKLTDAEAMLLEGYEILRSVFGESSSHTAGALRRLVELYEACGQPEEANTYIERLRRPLDAGIGA